MIHAAGILFVCGDRVLFLRRADTGQWEFPGGHIEDGETAEEAAEREAREELGPAPYGNCSLLLRHVADGTDYTTFLAQTNNEFTPRLSDEHIAWMWAPLSAPPQPLHQGCELVLSRLSMTELDVARAIAEGKFISPQRFDNIWLWAIRITGTGASYRAGLDEYVWRDSSHYLNDEFLARCAGLPVVWEHPAGNERLNSEEFSDRVIGTVMFAYIKGEDVWGIARIYDDNAATLMLHEKLSTSPGVVFKSWSGNESFELPDGSHLLIEGKPALLDHVAVCEAGVWDKGGPPTGVLTTEVQQEPIGMTEEEKAAADKARKDAEDKLHEKLDAALAKLDAAHARLEALEKARKDAEEDEKREERTASDRKARKDAEENEASEGRERAKMDRKARKDADESEESREREHTAMDRRARKDAAEEESEEERDDAEEDGEARDDLEGYEENGVFHPIRNSKGYKRTKTGDPRRKPRRHDSAESEEERSEAPRADSALVKENQELKSRLAAIEGIVAHLTRETSPNEADALARAQARADAVAGLFGERAAPPLVGESSLDYRKRLASKFKQHSPKFKDVRLDSMDAAVLDAVEEIIYNDAANAAKTASRGGPGILIPIVEQDFAGRRVTKFTGDPLAWMAPFMTGAQVGRFIRKPNDV